MAKQGEADITIAIKINARGRGTHLCQQRHGRLEHIAQPLRIQRNLWASWTGCIDSRRSASREALVMRIVVTWYLRLGLVVLQRIVQHAAKVYGTFVQSLIIAVVDLLADGLHVDGLPM